MNDNFAIQLFEGKKVRIVWDAEKEKYYFAVADIVQVLTDTVDPRDYIKKMLRRDPELKSSWGTICPPTRMMAADGKVYKTQAASAAASFPRSAPPTTSSPLNWPTQRNCCKTTTAPTSEIRERFSNHF